MKRRSEWLVCRHFCFFFVIIYKFNTNIIIKHKKYTHACTLEVFWRVKTFQSFSASVRNIKEEHVVLILSDFLTFLFLPFFAVLHVPVSVPDVLPIDIIWCISYIISYIGGPSLSLSVLSSYLQVPSLLSFAFPQHISPCFAVKRSNACSCCMWRNVDWLTIRRIPAYFASSWCSLSCFALIFRSSSSLRLFPPIAGITSHLACELWW